jgi:hypothetical protein
VKSNGRTLVVLGVLAATGVGIWYLLRSMPQGPLSAAAAEEAAAAAAEAETERRLDELRKVIGIRPEGPVIRLPDGMTFDEPKPPSRGGYVISPRGSL